MGGWVRCLDWGCLSGRQLKDRKWQLQRDFCDIQVWGQRLAMGKKGPLKKRHTVAPLFTAGRVVKAQGQLLKADMGGRAKNSPWTLSGTAAAHG